MLKNYRVLTMIWIIPWSKFELCLKVKHFSSVISTFSKVESNLVGLLETLDACNIHWQNLVASQQNRLVSSSLLSWLAKLTKSNCYFSFAFHHVTLLDHSKLNFRCMHHVIKCAFFLCVHHLTLAQMFRKQDDFELGVDVVALLADDV